MVRILNETLSFKNIFLDEMTFVATPISSCQKKTGQINPKNVTTYSNHNIKNRNLVNITKVSTTNIKHQSVLPPPDYSISLAINNKMHNVTCPE